MNIKLIAVDIDGTVVADDHMTVPEINIKALRRAHDAGIIIVISSGRTFSIARKEIMQIGCVDYMVMSNGAAVMDINCGETVYHNYLSDKNIHFIMDIFDQYPVVYEVYAKEGAFINQNSRDNFFKTNLPREFLEEYITRFELKDDIRRTALESSVEKICVNYLEKKYWPLMNREIHLAEGLEISSGYAGNMEITAKDADKGTALAKLCERLGIHAENVMVFGDSANDATMLKWAGVSFAMQNGNRTAKEAAKNITQKNNSEGGVGDTIMKCLFSV